MIVLGVILLILGIIFGISILTYIGVVLHRDRCGVLDPRVRRPRGRRHEERWY